MHAEAEAVLSTGAIKRHALPGRVNAQTMERTPQRGTSCALSPEAGNPP